jgi:hypothetical protein
MGREQFLQIRAGNWSKVAMWYPCGVLGKKFFQPPLWSVIDTAYSRRPLTSLRSLTSVPSVTSRVSCSCPLSEVLVAAKGPMPI